MGSQIDWNKWICILAVVAGAMALMSIHNAVFGCEPVRIVTVSEAVAYPTIDTSAAEATWARIQASQTTPGTLVPPICSVEDCR